MSVFEQLTKDYKIPKMVKVRQNFPRPVLDDIPGTIKNELQQAGILDKIKKGDRLAITAGSRGVANIALITREIIRNLKDVGAQAELQEQQYDSMLPKSRQL